MRKFVIFLMLISVVTSSYGQSSKIGIKIGYNYEMGDLLLKEVPSSAFNTLHSVNSKHGWHLGLIYRKPFAEIFFLQTDFVYVQSSHQYEYAILSTDPLSTVDFNNKVLELNINLGVEFFDFIRAYGGIINMFNLGTVQESNNFKAVYDSYKLGYQLGVGLDVLIFTIDLTYKGNFNSDHGEIKIGNTNLPLSNTLSQLQLSVGIML